MTQYTLTYIRGTITEALVFRQRYKRLLRVGDRRLFPDVNPDLFQAVVDYLYKQKITSLDITQGNPCVGNDDFNYLWKLLLSFVLKEDGVVDAKESI